MSSTEPDFALKSPQSRGRFKFTLADGPGVPGFEPDVTGCNFDLVFRFRFLGGGLVVVEAIVDSPAQGRKSGADARNTVRGAGAKPHSRTAAAV